jgi:ABC-type transport system involved in multi-copper enzyme maturation permease subunit
MLWYKSFLETRSRFVIGLVIVVLSMGGIVFAYPRVARLLPLVPSIDTGGEVGRRIKEVAELSRSYRGYIWAQALRQNISQMVSLFAVLLGAGGLLSRASGSGTAFTLSLPVSRNRLLAVRTATGLAELAAVSFAPVLLLPLLSPAVGERFGIVEALVHGACFFAAGSVLFSLTALLSTVFHDTWQPVLIACAFAALLAITEAFLREGARYSLFGLMSGEMYFRDGVVPWLGLLAGAAVSAAMLFAASRSLARQDF